MKKKYQLIIISLLISLFIYLFYRTNKTIVNDVAIRLFSLATFTAFKTRVVTILPLSNVLVYSLPEGLWVLCITLTSRSLYFSINNRRFDCVYVPIIFCIALEVMQLLHITNGRFDFIDIGVSTVFWLIGRYIFNERETPQNVFTGVDIRNTMCWASYIIVYLSHVMK